MPPRTYTLQIMGVGPDVVADVEDLRNTEDARPAEGDGIYWDDTLQLWIYRPFAAGDLPDHAPRHMDPDIDPIQYLFLPGAAYRYLQDYINNTGSAGRFTHDGYTDHGDGSITINAGNGMIKTADNNLAPTPFCAWAARTFPNAGVGGIVDNSMNHIYVHLVAGVATLEVTQVEANINGHSQFEIFHCYRRGNALRIGLHGPNLDDTIHHVSDRAHAVGHIRTDGLETTEIVVRHIQMALGHLWAELTELPIPAIDTNPAGAADTFILWYHVAGVLTPFVGTAQVPNANYDNGVNAVALTPNRYGVYWLWVGEDGTMDIVMGRGNYTLSQAQGSTAPQDLPPEVVNMGTFIARIIIQQGGGTFLEVAYPWDKPLGYTSAIDHNTGLIGHQGGVNAERYHMTAAEYAALGAGITGNDYICLQDQKAQNTQGGTFTQGAWRTRDLTTEQSDAGGICALAANQFTLDAGDYEILAIAPAFMVERHQARLYNVTDTAVLITGTPMYAFAVNIVGNHSFVMGRFTIAAAKALEIQHYCAQTKANDGFGVEANFTTEVYTMVQLWKVA